MTNTPNETNYFQQRLDHETDCADVWQRFADGDPHLVLLDVRSASDFLARHIPGSVSLPHREITKDALDAFGPEAQFVTYCWGPHCNGATKGAAKITALGHPVREMLGGVWGWDQEGYEFASDEAAV